jgi:ribosome-binding factor A
MTQRTDRIDELLRQEIGKALEREVTDPAIGFVTVTDVETSQDLAHAKVWVSVIGSEEVRKATLVALRRAMPFIRHGLGSKIQMRRIPQLDVRLDESIQRGSRVLQILSELEEGRTPDESRPASETLPMPVKRLPHEGDAPIDPADIGAGSAARSSETAPARKPRSRRDDKHGRAGSGPHHGSGPGSASGNRKKPR